MKKIYNFCAGPAMLPEEVMQQAQREFIDWQGCGSSVMEISHRSKAFVNVAKEAEQDLRDLLNIPDNYAVLFMHGGGRGQFSAVALNFAIPGKKAIYLNSGSWSTAADSEASKFTDVEHVNLIKEIDGLKAAPFDDVYDGDASFVHYCPNETVDGIEISTLPKTGNVPLIADMSSCILSKPIDVSQYAAIYAGAQKNIGPSGLAIAIVNRDRLPKQQNAIPSIMDFALTDKHDSMYNTPPTYAWYLAGLVFKWLKSQGGVERMAEINQQKADLLYQYIDQSTFYSNTVAPQFRSRMNVPFQLNNSSLDQAFLQFAEAKGLMALQGHRSVGGMRASIYNAMPLEGVQALVDVMHEFAQTH